MKILGIFDGQHDSGASIMDDDKILAAVNEERLSRIKLDGGFPNRSIQECFRISNVKEEDIDAVVVGSILTPPIFARMFRKLQSHEAQALSDKGSTLMKALSDMAKYDLRLTIMNPEYFSGRIQIPLARWLIRRELPQKLRPKPIYFVKHHDAHAASAFYASGHKEALAITCDCWGDGVSFAVYVCNSQGLHRKYVVPAFDSFGHFYAAVTKHLGFKPIRHEGKILGLAAHGDPNKVKVDFPFSEKDGKPKFLRPIRMEVDAELAKQLSQYSREDVAAWLQHYSEEWIVRLAKRWIGATGQKHVVLAGGVFSNVRINQFVHEIPGVQSIYIFPHMGDGGLAVGGSMFFLNAEKHIAARLEHVYLGPEYSDKEIEQELKKEKLTYQKPKSVEKEIAKLLAEGHVVARFNGKMEYGPRALGNRSILYQATDPTVNDWLNKRLQRTEFMPFAPSTLEEDAPKCYHKLAGGEFAARFMTITYDCTDFMKKHCPATVHVDGTARPQLVREKENPSYYTILKEYKKLTGLPSFINTSFNMHEEPIVCSPYDAIRAFLLGHLDYLAIGPFLVKNPNPQWRTKE